MRLALSFLDELTAGRLSYKERMRGGPRWLSSELVATEPAQERLRKWFENNPQPWTTPSAGDILVALHFVGDVKLHQILAKTLCLLPPPVVEHVTQNSTFIGIGSRIMGFAGARPAIDNRPYFVVLSTADTMTRTIEFILHELSHVWLMAEPESYQVAGEALYGDVIYDTPLEKVPARALDAVVAARKTKSEHERVAENLTRDWCRLLNEQNGDKK